MRTSSKSALKSFILFILLIASQNLFAATQTNWTIAAEKFKYSKGQTSNSVTNATAETIPVNILEKLCKTLERNVMPDENLERERYKLRTERQSLFLQLSSAYKKRDALVLYDYSEATLKSKIKEENKAIKEVQKKIDENIKQLKETQLETEKKLDLIANGKYQTNDVKKSEIELILNIFKNIFKKDSNIITQENIQLYQSDFTRLYAVSDDISELPYTSGPVESAVYGAGINTLITGEITSYGDYLSVTVKLYLYPGAKLIGTITEIGSIQEMDILSTSIANQIIPYLTNSMPVKLEINLTPYQAKEKTKVYIDDILQPSINEPIIIESGIHSIQFDSEEYRSVGTTFYFEGNTHYKIDTEMEIKTDGHLQIGLRKPVLGDIFVNGEIGEKVDEKKTQIKINGKEILGEFISEDGGTAFFYVPDKYYYNESYVTINPKTFDREQYIDKRRRWMYGSYTLLMVSVIPTFYTMGKLENAARQYKDKNISYEEAVKIQQAANITQAITIGCGAFFCFELIRYLIAANSVLPQKAKAGNPEEYQFYDSSITPKASDGDEAEAVAAETTEKDAGNSEVVQKKNEQTEEL